jgi:hypothetical protein
MNQPLRNLFEFISPQYWQYIGDLSNIWGALLGTLAVIGSIVGFLKRDEIRSYFTRITYSDVGRAIPKDQQYELVIFTVSHATVPLMVIEKTQPKRIALIATEGSKAEAEMIAAQALGRENKIFVIDDKDDPAEAKATVNKAIAHWEGIAPERIAVDVTGGTTPMSIGAFMAAQQASVTTIYMKSEYDKEKREIKAGSSRLICIAAS